MVAIFRSSFVSLGQKQFFSSPHFGAPSQRVFFLSFLSPLLGLSASTWNLLFSPALGALSYKVERVWGPARWIFLLLCSKGTRHSILLEQAPLLSGNREWLVDFENPPPEQGNLERWVGMNRLCLDGKCSSLDFRPDSQFLFAKKCNMLPRIFEVLMSTMHHFEVRTTVRDLK